MPWRARTERLLADPGCLRVMCELAKGFMRAHDNSPRASSLFASQQRWLMSHVAIALHFQRSASAQAGLTLHNFTQAVVGHELASRNTARAFLGEAMQYGFARPISLKGGQHLPDSMLPIEPTEATIALLAEWFSVHLQALDALDGASRLPRFFANLSAALATMEPFVCGELLCCAEVRNPGPVYSLFTWMDQGGLLMDRLMAGIDWTAAAEGQRSTTDITSISEIARAYGLSRSHAARKLVDGERTGHIGWTGRRGHSAMWLSSDFRKDYARAQAFKLVIIDAAFSAAFASDEDPPHSHLAQVGGLGRVSKMGGDRLPPPQ
jgi:hypothetical protein